MKKFIFFLLALALFVGVQASLNTLTPAPKASAIMVPVGKNHQMISLQDLAVIKVRDFEKMTGRQMNFADRLTFKLAQREMRHSIRADGTVDSRKMKRWEQSMNGHGGFHLGGFALGFFLGLIGVLIAYLIKDDKRRNRVKWAWLGLIAWIVIWVAFIL